MLRLYFGDDTVSIEAAVQAITGKLEPAMAAANLMHVEGPDADLSQLAMVCHTLPFLGQCRVIVVRHLAERLKTAGKEANAAFIEMIQQMPPTTELVVTEPGMSGEGQSHPLFNLAVQFGEMRRFSVTADGNVEDWIITKAANIGVEFDIKAAVELHRRVGSDSLRLNEEIKKLALYCMDDKRVEVQQVRELVVPSEEVKVFDLVDAIGRKETKLALTLGQEMMTRQAEPAARLLVMMARQFRMLLITKDMLQEKRPRSELATALASSQWIVDKLAKQCSSFSMGELRQAMEKLLAADCVLKGGANISEQTVMMQLIAELTA